VVDQSLFTSNTDEWGTPAALFDPLNQIYKFDLDACSTPELAKCEDHITPEKDGLKASWKGRRVFINPPYSKMTLWAAKFIAGWKESEHQLMLVPARTDTRWFQSILHLRPKIFFIKGRLRFTGGQHCAPFPSVMIAKPGVGHWGVAEVASDGLHIY
jgi:phage N-6-adenine-methyltransferase